MKRDSRLGWKIKSQITRFVTALSIGFYKPKRKFLMDMIYGIQAGVGSNGIFVIDRGGDRQVLINGLLQRRCRFIIRAVGSRKEEGGLPLEDVISTIRYMHRREVVIQKRDGKKERLILRMGHRKVMFPGIEEELTAVAISGFGEKPMILLTDIKYKRASEFVNFILEAYLTRWKCEESFRFIKQSYQLEDVRLRSYVGLRNIAVLAHAVFYLVSVLLGQRLKLNILLKQICEKAQRFFEVPAFKSYAIADGIYKVLFAYGKGLEHAIKPEIYPQLSLPLDEVF